MFWLLGSCRRLRRDIESVSRHEAHVASWRTYSFAVTRRLDSWKEIAVHLGRRVRTVQRWEKEEGLPVHRLPHRRRGTVYALPEELDAWWASRALDPVLDSSESGPPTRRRTSLSGVLAVLSIAALATIAVSVAAWRVARAPGPQEAALPDRLLEARYLLNRGSASEVQRALQICSEMSRGPQGDRAAQAAIHECAAHAVYALTRNGAVDRNFGLRRARAEAAHALELDPNRADARGILTWTQFAEDWRGADAETGYRRAIALDPKAALPHHLLAGLLSMRGRHEESIAELRRAQRSAPLSAALNDDGCWFFYRARRFPEAIVEGKRALRLEPERPGALQCIVDSKAALGDHDGARDAAVAMLRSLSDPAAGAVASAPPEEAASRLARRLLERLAEKHRPADRMPAMPFAMLHSQLGDREEAFAWLERALRDHDPVLLLVRVHPYFDSLRGDPRLEPLLRRAGV
jgi:tetratricopeptide (TPR) repeat protein